MLYLAFAALQLVTHLRFSLAAGACPTPTGVPDWIDSSTPADACSKSICTGSFRQCSSRAAAKGDMVLVFSDEFNRDERDFVGQTGDRTWTAMDMYYSSDFAEEQNYKPDKVEIRQGALQLTMAEEQSFATLNSAAGPKTGVLMNKTSGMVQSWNKFCFTGGFVEFSIKLPGNAKDSGFWAAAWLEGNLGRAGYLRSTAGRWPYSYDLCDGSGKLPWSDSAGQRTTRCGNAKGRGAPEIDVLEYGIFSPPDYSGDTSPTPLYIHTMQMGPIAPPNTTYMKGFRTCEIPGVACPGARDKARGTYFTQPYSPLSSDEFPRAGSTLTDTYSASSRLGPEHFESHHTYSVLWEPGEYVRWYLDDQFLFEVNKEALRGQTNLLNQSIGDRLIPHEAMYIILNLAMSDKSWSKVSPDLKFPATMSVDYVRVYQWKSAVNIGCDPPDYPTQDIIACNKEEYLSPDEMGLWRLGVCSSIGSKDNQILLGFSIAAALVAIGAGALWLVWLRARVADKQLDDKQTLEDLQAVSGVGKEAGCHVTSWALANPTQALGATRPDLLAVGQHAQAQQSAASQSTTSLKTLKSM